jgi:glycosyltransferase involved in cell wall biosynthesis
VIVPSAHVRDRLLARQPGARVEVVPWGVGPPFSPGPLDCAALARLGAERPYVVTLATTQPRKGLDDALEAVRRVRAAGLPHRLVVVGARGWRDEALVARLRTGGALLTGRLSDEELVAALRGADALLFPSREEGFGFPALEAMACATPVVAWRTASLPEVCAGAAELAPLGDAEALAAALRRVLADRGHADGLRARGMTRAAELTWERCGERHVGLYRELCGSRT